MKHPYIRRIKKIKNRKKIKNTKKTKNRKKRTKKKALRHQRRQKTYTRRHKMKRRRPKTKRGGGHVSYFPHNRRTRKKRRGGNGEENKWKANFLKSIKSQKLKAAIPTWGTPHTQTKSLSNLYKEVKEGDSQIEFTDQGPIRVVNVVQMEIYPSKTKNKRLKERKHYSPDGQTVTKERDMLLSEKIQGGKEDPTAAAMRGIAEELGADHAITLLAAPQFIKENRTHSYSYPELPTQYRYFIGKAIVKGLPDPEQHSTFKTTEYNKDGSIKRMIEWAWEDVEPSNDDPTAAAAASATAAASAASAASANN